jgi:hypothetical protein
MIAVILIRQNGPKKKKGGGGQRKLLKRLIPNKGIQGNQSFFLGKIWPDLEPAWLDFERFGVGFERRNLRLRRDLAALPSNARDVIAQKCTTSGWQSLDSNPKSTLEARPRGVAPASCSKTIIAAGCEPVRPSQMEYRL